MMKILVRNISPRTLLRGLVCSSLPVLLGISVSADALQLYVDKRTNQVFTAPGKHRMRLGTFEQIDGGEEPVRSRRRGRQDLAPAGVNERIDTLEQKLEETQINAKLNEEKATAAWEASKAMPKVTTKGKLEWGTPDGDFTWRFGGRLHLDYTGVDNRDGSALVSGVDARRARLEFQGTLWKHWMWKLDYEFGQSATVRDGFRDAFVRYIEHGAAFPWTISVGQYKEIFGGLEHRNSSNDLPFVERALPSRVFHDVAEASDGRRLGIAFNINDKKWWTASVGVFGKNISGDSADEETDPIAVEGFMTFSPIHTETRALHFALGSSWMDPQVDSRVRFNARNEERIGAQRFVDTGVIEGANAVIRSAAEIGGIYGPAWLQAEYLRTDVQRKGANPDVNFDGYHVDVGYILTGESRIYDFERATFVNPKPGHLVGHGGWGAWELAARWSQLRLADQDIHGGIERNFSAGVNWYPTQNFRFMFTYTKVVDVSGGRFDGVDPNVFLVRAQVNF